MKPISIINAQGITGTMNFGSIVLRLTNTGFIVAAQIDKKLGEQFKRAEAISDWAVIYGSRYPEVIIKNLTTRKEVQTEYKHLVFQLDKLISE